MSYEEIDKANYENDVFTGGAEGRYAKPKATTEKKKRAPKVPTATTTTNDDITDQVNENGQTEEVVKTKKKTRKTRENEESIDNGAAGDEELAVKTKKKRAPKIESNDENLNPVAGTEEEPVKKKKSKAPKINPSEDIPLVEDSTINELEATPKVKKVKKTKKPKTTDDMQSVDLSINPELNDEFSQDVPSEYPIEAEQLPSEPKKSEYETAIFQAYNNLSSKMKFTDYVGSDQWCILHPPKSARTEPKSRIRKMLPGGNNSTKSNDKSSNGRNLNQQKGLFGRLVSGVNTLIRDESNLIVGEPSNYELAYYDEEEDGVDTDDLHRYAQKLRELEDQDREVNPEFLVLRDGKTVFAVHESDADGKMTLSTRKPIYDRQVDQGPDETPEKKNFLSRLRRNPFGRNKDSKDSNSPKSSHGTPDNGRKQEKKKSQKTTDDDMANNEP